MSHEEYAFNIFLDLMKRDNDARKDPKAIAALVKESAAIATVYVENYVEPK